MQSRSTIPLLIMHAALSKSVRVTACVIKIEAGFFIRVVLIYEGDTFHAIIPIPCLQPSLFMPQLIWCLDNYFEEKKKDCYFVVFGRKFPIKHDDNFKKSENPPGRAALLSWFKAHYPHIAVEPVWPHSSTSLSLFFDREYDGSVTIEFDDESLRAFCEEWEDEDQNGCSRDGTFICYHLPYASYLENRG